MKIASLSQSFYNKISNPLEKTNSLAPVFSADSLSPKNFKNNSDLNLPSYKYLQGYANISFKGDINNSGEDDYLVTPLDKLNDNIFLSLGDNILTYISVQDKKNIPLFINKAVVNKYLKNEKQELDLEKTNRFISIYKNLLERNLEVYNNLKDYLESIKDTPEANTSLSCDIYNKNGELVKKYYYDDSYTEDEEDEEYDEFDEYDEYDDNQPDTHREIIEGVVEEHTRKLDDVSTMLQQTFNNTMLLFEMSKTKNGYDFSKLNLYGDCLDKINELQEMEQDAIDIAEEEDFDIIKEIENQDKPLAQRIIEASRSKKGNFNYDFASQLCDILETNDEFPAPVEYGAYLVKKYTAKNPHHAEIAINTLENLIPILGLNEEENLIEPVMDKCYNPINNTFDTNVLQKVLNFYSETCRLISESNNDYIERDMEEETELLCDYLDETRDKSTGYIKDSKDCISIEQFLYDNRNGYEFLQQIFG